ncbi:MAG: hypothetical protein H8E55_19810 [Pelagibacterales bacterium]|nr:hypothetical protein [Pelagibacterales bacterium]
MSYSRWGNSKFYTYWASADSNIGQKQQFHIQEVGPSLTFTFAKLYADLEGCLDKVEEFYSKERKASYLSNGDLVNPEYKDTILPPQPIKKEDREELALYMLKFIEDVKEDKDLKW